MANEVTYYFSGSAISKHTKYFKPRILILFGKYCFKNYTLTLLKMFLQKDSLKYGTTWTCESRRVTSSLSEWVIGGGGGGGGLTLFGEFWTFLSAFVSSYFFFHLFALGPLK